jgi:hypothetical protein
MSSFAEMESPDERNLHPCAVGTGSTAHDFGGSLPEPKRVRAAVKLILCGAPAKRRLLERRRPVDKCPLIEGVPPVERGGNRAKRQT